MPNLFLYLLGTRCCSVDRVTGHARGCAHEWVCPKLNVYGHVNKVSLALASVVRAFPHGSSDRSFVVDPFSYFLFQPVIYDWFNQGFGMCYPVCGMVHIKEPLLLIGKSSPCVDSGFPLSLSEWSFTMCLTPYNCKYNVLSASLNTKVFSSFFIIIVIINIA